MNINMSKDDDDLRFGDVDHERDDQKNNSGSDIDLGAAELGPIAVGGIIGLYLLITQPFSGAVGGFSMNLVLGLAAVAMGVMAAADD